MTIFIFNLTLSCLFSFSLLSEILSTECMISCGVPQGSVLGPLLFLIYINDIHNSSAKLSFYLFADDTSLLYADSNLKSLEKTVNSELLKVSDWLNANKLTLNAKKSNYVIFRPYQRKLNYSINIEMIDNCTQIPTTLQCEDHVKYLGVVARLRHFVPRTTLLNIYQSLILPHLTYGLAAWGQAAKTHLKKILVLQKRALRLMYFSEPRAHAVPLFISSKILPLQMLYAEKVSSIMFDVSCMNAPSNICDFFTKANSKHRHETRFSSSGNYYVQTSRLNLNQDSFSRFGAKLWNAIPNEFRQLSKGAFKKNFHDFLLSIMEAEDDYVEVPILLQKMANSASSTQCI